MKKLLIDNGVDISKVDIKAMDPGPAITALSAGKIDGVFLPHPSPATIELNGKGESVVSSGEMWPNHACCSLVVSGELIRENPDLVLQILRINNNALYASTSIRTRLQRSLPPGPTRTLIR